MADTNAVRRQKGLRALIDTLEPRVAEGYFASVADLRDSVVMTHLVDALERRDIEAALDALNIEPAAFAPLRRSIQQAYEAGGNLTSNSLPTRVA